MRIRDILMMAWQELWYRKTRTCLNLIGIVIGCCMLLLTAAGATGARGAFQRLFDSSELVRQIWVGPKYYYAPDPPAAEIQVASGLNPEREGRIRKAMEAEWRIEHREAGLDSIPLDSIRKMERLPNVKRVIPDTALQGTLSLSDDVSVVTGELRGIDVQSTKYAKLLLAGKMLSAESNRDVLVSEWLAYRLGYQTDAELADIIGRQIDLEYSTGHNELRWMYSMLSEQFTMKPNEMAEQVQFAAAIQRLLGDLDKTTLTDQQQELIRKLTQKIAGAEQSNLPQIHSQRFTIRGVVREDEDTASPLNIFRMWFHKSQGDVFVHHRTANAIQLTDPNRQKYTHATVVVESADALAAASDAIRELRLEPMSAERLWTNIKQQIDNATRIVYGLALAVLLASAFGISNTLLISLLQRTPEFGILKSVGARDRDLLWVMLTEGLLLGLLGATLALLFGLLLAVFGQGFLANYIAQRSGTHIEGPMFQIRPLAVLFVYLAAVVICVVASVLPAWRAARMDPIRAMQRT